MSYYIGVDVGTGSARACIIDDSGEILSVHSKDISKWEPKVSYFNQSSTQIWDSICWCTQKIIQESKVDPKQIRGIGFDATCSLVVLNEKSDKPVGVGPDFNNSDQNIILWMDHRAEDQTNAINSTGHNLLRYVGGKMSIEMEMPKVKWLKENMPKGMFNDCKFYDLADFLTHRATGSETRSFCSVVCKQGYVPVGIDGSVKGWSADFLNEINLPELVEDNFRRIGGVKGQNGQYLSAGHQIGHLSETAAKELGLTTDVAVGSGVIDAYAGWIGTVAAKTSLLADEDIREDDISLLENRLAAVAGTSTCHLVMSKDPIFVPGVWGPYRDVLIPDYWLAEGGQSTTGELLKFVVTSHPASAELKEKATAKGESVFEYLNNRLDQLRALENAPSIAYLAKHLFFYGDFYGNRSPIADPHMRGSIIGQDMDTSLDNLAITYLGAVEFIGQQTRHIIDTLNERGHKVNQIYLSGGQCRNHLLTYLMATATGMPVIIPKYIDAAVVLGAAFLGAKAVHPERHLLSIMAQLSGPGTIVDPSPDQSLDRKLLNAKYKVFLDQAQSQQRYRDIVDSGLAK